jgi:hypothetical protein
MAPKKTSPASDVPIAASFDRDQWIVIWYAIRQAIQNKTLLEQFVIPAIVCIAAIEQILKPLVSVPPPEGWLTDSERFRQQARTASYLWSKERGEPPSQET